MTTATPWSLGRMSPMANMATTLFRFDGLDPDTQTGRYVDASGNPILLPTCDGAHGTSVNTYPPTQIGKDGKIDPDSGFDAEQDEG